PRRPPTRDRCTSHVCPRPIWRRLGLVEVSVTIDEEQSVASPPSERQEIAKQDAAVTAEHHREQAAIEQGADPVGQVGGVGADAVHVEDACLRVTLRIMGWRRAAPGGGAGGTRGRPGGAGGGGGAGPVFGWGVGAPGPRGGQGGGAARGPAGVAGGPPTTPGGRGAPGGPFPLPPGAAWSR